MNQAFSLSMAAFKGFALTLMVFLSNRFWSATEGYLKRMHIFAYLISRDICSHLERTFAHFLNSKAFEVQRNKTE